MPPGPQPGARSVRPSPAGRPWPRSLGPGPRVHVRLALFSRLPCCPHAVHLGPVLGTCSSGSLGRSLQSWGEGAGLRSPDPAPRCLSASEEVRAALGVLRPGGSPSCARLPAARGRRPGRLRPWFLPGQRAAPMWGSRLPVLLSRWLRVWGGGSVLSHLCHLLPESWELGCFNDLEPQPPEAQAVVVRSCCLAKLRENTLTDHVGFSGLWLYSVKESLNNTSFPPTPSLAWGGP